MNTVDDVYRRVRADPVRHLGRKNVRLAGAYALGYELAYHRWERPVLPEPLDWQMFQDWVERRCGCVSEEGCRQNVAGFAELMTADEQAAFDLYFEWYDGLRRELGAPVVQAQSDLGGFVRARQGLLGFVTDEHFKSRPGMYLGQTSVDNLWALCNGYRWAEQDLAIESSDDQILLDGFQRWIEARYPFAAGRPWNRTLSFLALNSHERTWSMFYDLFEIFRAGEAPDAMSKTARAIVANMAKAFVAKNPGANPEDAAKSFEGMVKKITTY